MALSLVIPCFNEADGVRDLCAGLTEIVPALRAWHPIEILIVDDGSTDGTFETLSAHVGGLKEAGASVRVLRHQTNRGLGAALSTGFATATGDVVVTTDSDATYPFGEIPKLLAYLTPDVDIVTASPYHRSGGVVGVPPYRLALSRGASCVYRALVDHRIRTYTALFRAYRRAVLADVPFSSGGYLAVTELLVNARLMGYRIAEYPAVLHGRGHGASKARVFTIVLSHLRFQAGLLLRRSGLKKMRPLSSRLDAVAGTADRAS